MAAQSWPMIHMIVDSQCDICFRCGCLCVCSATESAEQLTRSVVVSKMLLLLANITDSDQLKLKPFTSYHFINEVTAL